MAITFIYPIKVTGEKSLDYDMENKEAKAEKNDGQDSLNYVLRDKKDNVYMLSTDYLEKMKDYIYYENDVIRFKTLSTSLNCSLTNTYEEWECVRKNLNPGKGNTGNLQYCIVQNFGTDIDPAVANEIGIKFAQEYLSDYQCVVSSHINTGLVHNHIEFNATSFVSGKKFNDNLKAVSDIRKISDKFCKEYELQVLEETKDFRYVVYRDDDGRTRIYEPTKRKNEASRGKYSVNDYRNTIQYQESQKTKKSHIDLLKTDIDRSLPFVSDYGELLLILKGMGYEIKDKTKKGEWRKHISFRAPGWEKDTRDNSLGEDYTRESLTSRILFQKIQQSGQDGKSDIDNEIKSLIMDDMEKIAHDLSISVDLSFRSFIHRTLIYRFSYKQLLKSV